MDGSPALPAAGGWTGPSGRGPCWPARISSRRDGERAAAGSWSPCAGDVLAGSMTTRSGRGSPPSRRACCGRAAQVVERPGARREAATSVEETLLLADWVLEAGARHGGGR